jgi:hypothetical protein
LKSRQFPGLPARGKNQVRVTPHCHLSTSMCG